MSVSLTESAPALEGAADPFKDSFAPSEEREVVAHDSEVDSDGVDESPAESEPSEPSASGSEPGDAGQAEKQQPQDDATGGFDDALFAEAEPYGLTKEDVEAYGSPELFRRAMRDMDRLAATWGHEQLAGEQQDTQAHSEQPTHQQPVQAQQQAPAQGESLFEKYKVELNPDEFDEQVVQQFTKLNDHYSAQAEKQEALFRAMAQRIASQQTMLDQITGQSKAEGVAQETREFDTFLASLGDEYAEIYGKQPITELPPASPLFTARQQLYRETKALERAYGKRFTRSQLYQRALGLLHPNIHQTAARKEIQAQVKNRRAQAVARPSGHNGKAASPDDRATQAVAKIMRERGVSDDHSFRDGF